jgi:hypothetical protein
MNDMEKVVRQSADLIVNAILELENKAEMLEKKIQTDSLSR